MRHVMVAAAWLGVTIGAGSTASAQVNEPLDLRQSYSGVSAVDVGYIATYNQYLRGNGISNSYSLSAGAFTFDDPFLKSSANPPLRTFFMGVSTSEPVVSARAAVAAVAQTQHLVLALGSAFAAGLVSGGQDFATIFTGYDESSLINDLVLIGTGDLDEANDGYAAQMQAKNAAYSELFSFGSEVDGRLGTTFAFGGPLTLLSFSTPTVVGNGVAAITVLSSDVPEPASWAMMVAGFGLAGAALRKRRIKVAFAS